MKRAWAWVREHWLWLLGLAVSIIAGLLAILARRPRPADKLEADLRVIDDAHEARVAAAGEVREATVQAADARHALAERDLHDANEAKAEELAAGPPQALSDYLNKVTK